MEEVKTRAQEPIFEIGNVLANLDTFDDDGVIPRLDYRDPSIYRYIQNEVTFFFSLGTQVFLREN